MKLKGLWNSKRQGRTGGMMDLSTGTAVGHQQPTPFCCLAPKGNFSRAVLPLQGLPIGKCEWFFLPSFKSNWDLQSSFYPLENMLEERENQELNNWEKAQVAIILIPIAF